MDPREPGPKVVDMLQNMKFPRLDCDSLIDDIIYKCWQNKYATVENLAAHTESLLVEGDNDEATNRREPNDGSCDDYDYWVENFSSKTAICQDFEKRELLQLLSSGEPEQIGFTFERLERGYGSIGLVRSY